MSIDAHARAQELVGEAALLGREGNRDAASNALGEAARLEERAMLAVPRDRRRTRSVLAVSAVSLYWRAGWLHEAERAAYSALASGNITDFGRSELLDLALVVRQQQEVGSEGAELGSDVFRVDLNGSAVKSGGLAPLDAVVLKLQQFRGYATRVGEWTLGRPFRQRGEPSRENERVAIPLLSPARVGSYSFDLRFETIVQQPLLEAGSTGAVADNFVQIIDTAAHEPAALSSLVPDRGYAPLFLKLVRNLAPTGRQFTEVAVTRKVGGASTTYLRPESRIEIQKQIHALEPEAPDEERIEGVLRALNLDRRTLKLVRGTQSYTCAVEKGIGLDDEIGPLVNHRVSAVGRFRGATFRVRDLFEADSGSD